MDWKLPKVANSKEKIFHHLLEYKNTIFYICMGYTSDYAQAEELTQDIFLKAWEQIEKIKHSLNLKGWFFTLAKKNVWIMSEFRRRLLPRKRR